MATLVKGKRGLKKNKARLLHRISVLKIELFRGLPEKDKLKLEHELEQIPKTIEWIDTKLYK